MKRGQIKERRFSCKKEQTTDVFDYYNVKVQIGTEALRYYFEIKGTDGETIYYNRYGAVSEPLEAYDFLLIPNFSTPGGRKAL